MKVTTEADMKRLYEYMDKMGVDYTVDNNPSPEKIERIKKMIERRDARFEALRKCFAEGGLEEIKKYLDDESN